MKIDREIKQPEWDSDGRYATAYLDCKLGLNVWPGLWQGFSWSINDTEMIEIESGESDTLDQAKADAWAAYLNLIFH